jgi:hypothetical protein
MSNLILSVCMLISVTGCIFLSFKYFEFINAVVNQKACEIGFFDVFVLSVCVCAYPIARLWLGL